MKPYTQSAIKCSLSLQVISSTVAAAINTDKIGEVNSTESLNYL